MEYSHRDHRVYRDAFRVVGAVAAATTALEVVALVVPGPFVPLLAVLGLGSLGGAALIASGRLVEQYQRDLRNVRGGGRVPAHLRVEVESSVGFDRVMISPSVSSPHSRRRRGEPDDAEPLEGSGPPNAP